MPDDDSMLGQNLVDVRNEGRRNAMLGEQVYACHDPEGDWIRDQQDENPSYGPGNPDWEHDFDRDTD